MEIMPAEKWANLWSQKFLLLLIWNVCHRKCSKCLIGYRLAHTRGNARSWEQFLLPDTIYHSRDHNLAFKHTVVLLAKSKKSKGAYYRYSISQLRDVTCHMGSHSVTCHPTQVNFSMCVLLAVFCSCRRAQSFTHKITSMEYKKTEIKFAKSRFIVGLKIPSGHGSNDETTLGTICDTLYKCIQCTMARRRTRVNVAGLAAAMQCWSVAAMLSLKLCTAVTDGSTG